MGSLRQSLKSSQVLVELARAMRAVPEDLRRWRQTRSRGGLVAGYLAGSGPHRLQLGSGKNDLPGWLNTDYVPRHSGQPFLDATRPFPLPDASFDAAFTEHVIEHLSWVGGQNLLRETHRVLKPGGVLRIATPDLRRVVTLLDEPADDVRREYIAHVVSRHMKWYDGDSAALVLNNFFWDFGHLCVYDETTLADACRRAGFTTVRRVSHHESSHPLLRGLEKHHEVVGRRLNDFETMIVEAVKL